MSGLQFMGEVPYTRMYLHGTVRDTQHRKMSKSLGNGIDPLEVVERYGADALRYSLISGMSVGTDVILDPEDLESSFAPGAQLRQQAVERRAASSCRTSTGRRGRSAGRHADVVRREELTLADRWIIARCDATVREATEAYERFRLNEAAAAVYRFIWSDLADWYIEQIKPRLYGDQPGGDVARAVVGADVRRGAAPAPPGDAVRHRGALAAVPRPAGDGLDLGRSVAPPRPAGARTPRRCATSGWSRRSSAPSAAFARSTACSRARQCAPW